MDPDQPGTVGAVHPVLDGAVVVDHAQLDVVETLTAGEEARLAADPALDPRELGVGVRGTTDAQPAAPHSPNGSLRSIEVAGHLNVEGPERGVLVAGREVTVHLVEGPVVAGVVDP